MATKKTTTKKASVSKTSVPIKVSQSAKAEMRKWEIESALSTLKRADEIRKDAKMMNDVKKLAQEQMSVLKTFSK
jgi:RPA family protein